MIFSDTGRVSEDFYVLGTSGVPSYLLTGPKPVLFDAGFTCLGKRYETEIREVLGAEEPQIIFLTHAHYDHIGAVSYLKKAFGGLKVAASAGAEEILRKPKALELIGFLTEQARVMVTKQAEILGALDEVVDDPFSPFEIDIILGDGQKIDLGGEQTLEVIATPGHTRDFLSYYIPERKILIASESVGCADATGYILTEFLTDYDAYVASLKRLSEIDVEVLCQGHYYVYVGQDARDYFGRSLEAAEVFRSRVEAFLEEEQGDVDSAVSRIKAIEWDDRPEPKQPEPAYLINTRVRVEQLKKRLGAVSKG